MGTIRGSQQKLNWSGGQGKLKPLGVRSKNKIGLGSREMGTIRGFAAKIKLVWGRGKWEPLEVSQQK